MAKRAARSRLSRDDIPQNVRDGMEKADQDWSADTGPSYRTQKACLMIERFLPGALELPQAGSQMDTPRRQKDFRRSGG